MARYAPADARRILADREGHPAVRRNGDGSVDVVHSYLRRPGAGDKLAP